METARVDLRLSRTLVAFEVSAQLWPCFSAAVFCWAKKVHRESPDSEGGVDRSADVHDSRKDAELTA